MDVSNLVQTVAIYALPVLFAITLHEAAHGYVARHFGDMTAYAQGRISLNPARHIDLVHHARRRWNGILPNCRLITLELHICKRRRSGDVPSAEVPGLYHDFVKYGGAHRLIPVFHHNLLDVTTMDEILRALVGDPPPELCEEELPVYEG